ncbi:MAG: class I SAM-dependent methyltransferase, partial [Pyrinomonadaceae bacterium MAG19_C2-C3]|nr:class I SAM-dependent methyltransferase [Pyrinomonadaceae bacterium MAG19_C2-C3]
YNKVADDYDAKAAGHDIPIEAEPLYKSDLLEILGETSKRTLEIGVGTGRFAALLDAWGYGVTGVDFSPAMLKHAQENLPHLDLRLIDDAETMPDDYFPPASFDLIVCRQVACHFLDPIKTFAKWKNWLAPNGRVVIIEGLWSRFDWAGDWQNFVDVSPLTCTQTWATFTYLLKQAGYEEAHGAWLNKINGYEAVRAFSTNAKPMLRFVVVARANII